jgi:serine/threonine protein kinase
LLFTYKLLCANKPPIVLIVLVKKCFIMVKALQFVRMIWGFISIWFMKFGTYVGNGRKQSNELGDILKWQREEVTNLQEILKVEQVLNGKQCINLVDKLDQVVLYVNEMITCTKETTNKFGLVLGELRRVTRKIRILVEDCGKQEWCNVVAFQINNTESFRELMDDLQCFWDAMCEKYLAIYPDSHDFRIPSIDFSVATYDEIESDEKAMVERLEKCLETMPNDSEGYELGKYLLRRLQFELPQVRGGELNAFEIPNDVAKPVLLKQIGFGAAGEVHKSSWLGLICVTKMLGVIPNFHKEAGILACLGHPNLVKFICCGRFNETHKGNVDESNNVSRNLFLVMELMEMSLSDFVKKQKTPLPYFVVIDMMHEIARGMCYLHDMHVAHLDLKPSNVLLSSMSRLVGAKGNIGYDFVKLTDYGDSKTEVQSKPELQEFTIGTPKYMAPEMNNNKNKSLSNMACPFAADVWSFGMTCSEILSLKEPFLGTDNRKVILQKIKDGWRPKLPINCEELTTLIEECWIEDPLQRPTFSNICKRLATLKKKFMVGIYSNGLPQFKGWNIFNGWTCFPSIHLEKQSNPMNVFAPKKVRTHSITICLLCIFEMHSLIVIIKLVCPINGSCMLKSQLHWFKAIK